MEVRGRGGREWWCAIAASVILLVALPAGFLFASSWKERAISVDYKVCVIGADEFTVHRYDVIDVEKVHLSKRGKIFAELIFSEMGTGAYSKMIQDAAVTGVSLRKDSHIIVYGQLFQRDGLFFIAKSSQPNLPPVWIYAKFFDGSTLDAQSSALKMMASLKPCHGMG